jgi:membrane-associated phospholipid phosphatase
MRYWVFPAAVLACFVAIAATSSNQPLFLALNRIGPATSDLLWANVTVLGDTAVALALCLPLLWRRRPDLVWALLFTVILGTLWVHGIKQTLDVPRPPAVLQQLHVIGPAYKAGSFPSGHATTAFAIAGLIALGGKSRPLGAIALGIAALAALSRPVVGVHWPLDVLAGMFGGWLSAVLGLVLAGKTLKFGTQPWVQWILGALLALCAAVLVYGNTKSGYPQTLDFQRVLGLACLLFAGARLIRDFRRRPGL